MGSLTLTGLFRGRYTFKAPRKYGGYFRKDSDHRDFVSIGTAAGAAASWPHSPLDCPGHACVPKRDPEILIVLSELRHASTQGLTSPAFCASLSRRD